MVVYTPPEQKSLRSKQHRENGHSKERKKLEPWQKWGEMGKGDKDALAGEMLDHNGQLSPSLKPFVMALIESHIILHRNQSLPHWEASDLEKQITQYTGILSQEINKIYGENRADKSLAFLNGDEVASDINHAIAKAIKERVPLGQHSDEPHHISDDLPAGDNPVRTGFRMRNPDKPASTER